MKARFEEEYAPLEDVVFPWNDTIDMTSGGSDNRAIVICLSAVFDAIQGLRADIRVAMRPSP